MTKDKKDQKDKKYKKDKINKINKIDENSSNLSDIDNHSGQQEALLFPCEFPIKVFGAANDEFEKNVLAIIHKHVPDLAENAISNRLSKEGKYLALTITLQVNSRAELDAIYQELSVSPHVMMAL